MAAAARLSTAGRSPRYSDGGEAGQPSDIGVGNRLAQDLLRSGCGRRLLPGGRSRGDVTVGITAAAVVGEVQGVEDFPECGVVVVLGAHTVRGVISRAGVTVTLGRTGVRGVVFVALTFPGESPGDRSEEPDSPQFLSGRGSRIRRDTPASVFIRHRK